MKRNFGFVHRHPKHRIMSDGEFAAWVTGCVIVAMLLIGLML